MKRRDVLLGIGAVSISQAPMAQLAEAVASNPTQCEFDSRLGYQLIRDETHALLTEIKSLYKATAIMVPYPGQAKDLNDLMTIWSNTYKKFKDYGPFA